MLCVRKLRLPIRNVNLSPVFLGGLERLALYGNHRIVSGLFGDSYHVSQRHKRSFPSSDHWGMFSSSMSYTVLIQARDPAKLGLDIENAIDEHRYHDAWMLFERHMHMDGFPRKSLVNKLLAGFTKSLDVHWLDKAYGLVELAFEKGMQNLFEKESLIYLSLGLAICGSSVSASTILRRLIHMEHYPPVSCWSAILAHMSGTASGAFLAAELILEISFLFMDGKVDPRKKSNAPLIAMKPNTNAFNIALVGCLLFGISRKAEQLLEIFPRLGVRTNTTMLIMMAYVCERNGRREEIKKLQRHIDEAPDISHVQLCQYYNCLLSCHLKLGDIHSVSGMVLEMLRKAKAARNTLSATTLLFDSGSLRKSVPDGSMITGKVEPVEDATLDQRSIIPYEEFSKDRNFVNMEAEAQRVLSSLLAKLQIQDHLVRIERGILQPTESVYVKLVKAFLEADNIKDLTSFLISAEREDSPASNDDSALVHVINVCISLGWLDQAHDILDEMRLAGASTGSSVYSSLLKAYCNANRIKEAASLVKDARKAGIQLEGSSYEALISSKVLQKDTQGALDIFKEMNEAKIPRSGLQKFDVLVHGCAGSSDAGPMSKLLEEIKDGQRIDSGVHDWNNVIHFFCKKRLMHDAEKALKKMRNLGLTPNAQTFHSLVTGYAAIGGKYIEVTELWGEMKSLSSSTPIKFDQELLDSVLYMFVRGGFFVRANEVVEMLEKGKMFVDKYKYRTLFLKYHKTLYKGKAPKFQTEAQLKKREAALAFKKWVGLC